MNEDNKKITKKCHYFKKSCAFVFFFTNEIEGEMGKQDFSNKVIDLNATIVLIFQDNGRKTWSI